MNLSFLYSCARTLHSTLKKQTGALLILSVVGTAGCYSAKTTAGIAPHKIKVVDGSTQHPITGATVQLSGSGSSLGQKTDEQGLVRLGSDGFYSLPKSDTLEVTMQGYNRVAFRLTNGLPHRIELTPVESQKP